MIINHNMQAINTHRQMGHIHGLQSKNMEKLSSGYRVNRAGDDAAGLAISEKMRGQIRGLNQATRNAQDAVSLVQTAEGALAESQNIIQRMRELAVQAANDTNEAEDRAALQNEVNELGRELDRIAGNTEFNKKLVLNGDYATGATTLNFQVGANQYQVIKLNIDKFTTQGLGIKSGKVDVKASAAASLASTKVDISAKKGGYGNSGVGEGTGVAVYAKFADLRTHTLARQAMKALDSANKKISAQRARLGAVQNRLEHTIVNDKTTAENLQAAESRIRDVDMAREMMKFTKNNILAQASQAMLSQATQTPQQVLQLLR